METADLKKLILKMFKGDEFHGYEVDKRLKRQGVEVELGRLYKVLNEMLREGLLESHWHKSQLGPKKRVYQLGGKGKEKLEKILAEAIEIVHVSYGEYLLGLPSETSVFDRIAQSVSRGWNDRGNVVLVTPVYSAIIEKVLQSICRRTTLGNVYLVKPKSVEADIHLDNLSVLDGDLGNIPLKEGHADLEVIIYIPKKDSIRAAMGEWRRVLKEGGTLAILVPTTLVTKPSDPMTIGDFVERYEREQQEAEEYADRKTIQAMLRDLFRKVEERQVVHITLFKALKM